MLKTQFQNMFTVMLNRILADILAPALLNLLNLVRKSVKMFGKPHILSLFPNLFDYFNNT